MCSMLMEWLSVNRLMGQEIHARQPLLTFLDSGYFKFPWPTRWRWHLRLVRQEFTLQFQLLNQRLRLRVSSSSGGGNGKRLRFRSWVLGLGCLESQDLRPKTQHLRPDLAVCYVPFFRDIDWSCKFKHVLFNALLFEKYYSKNAR